MNGTLKHFLGGAKKNEALPDIGAVEDKLQQEMGNQTTQIQSSLDKPEDLLDGDDIKKEVLKSHWQTGVYQQPREVRPSANEVNKNTKAKS